MSLAYTAGLAVLLGFLPSLVWLFYYLRKDIHPEPKSMIAKTMLMGIVLAPLVLIFQLLFIKSAGYFDPSFQASGSALFFLWGAFVEEFFKFWAVKTVALNTPDFDEPTDAMIYMISAALGFAAVENILLLMQILPGDPANFIGVWLLRFGGATLLHALSSAILGYALAVAWFYRHHSKKIIGLGLAFATVFHFSFNVLLIKSSAVNIISLSAFFYPMSQMVLMLILVSFLFVRLRKRSAY